MRSYELLPQSVQIGGGWLLKLYGDGIEINSHHFMFARYYR